ncbi:MAG: M23 family metallopeptidase [Nitrososphaeraceae archaeon]
MRQTEDLLKRIGRTSSPVHLGKLRNAIDLIADEEKSVLGAADGIVTSVKDNSNNWGSCSWSHTNFIVIMHSNGEYSRYVHLSYTSSKVKFDLYVKEGEVIARVEMTRFTYCHIIR